ncbi:MAG TPA: phosphoribosyltransferase family protein [Rhizomicrobium sp.]
MLSALHTIRDYPFDPGEPVFARYPAMKFGDRASVRHFAGMLAPIALRRIAEAPPDRDWVLTSPPQRGLRCGANFVCDEVHAILAEALPGRRLALDPLRTAQTAPPFETEAEFRCYNDYSRQDVETRRLFRMGGDETYTYDLSNFAGRCCIFLNDINVTGTQLESMETILGSVVASLDFLLIVNVDPKIGRAFPFLESEINLSKLSGLDELACHLRDGEFRCTGKLISRLMSHEAGEIEGLLAALDAEKRRAIHRAVLEEGLYGGAFFAPKMGVVARAARAARTG